MVYSREQNDRTLTFLHSGKLWRDALVLMDHESGSLWSQVDGEAIAGEQTGQRLDPIPSVMTTWGQWIADHPETLVLPSDHRGRKLKMRLYPRASGMLGLLGTDNPDPRLPGKELIAGFESGDEAVAIHFPAGNDDQIARLEVDRIPIVVEKASRDGSVSAWRSAGSPEWRKLERIPASIMYWFVWVSLHPDTEIFAAEAHVSPP